jgi:hypothetical protein
VWKVANNSWPVGEVPLAVKEAELVVSLAVKLALYKEVTLLQGLLVLLEFCDVIDFLQLDDFFCQKC